MSRTNRPPAVTLELATNQGAGSLLDVEAALIAQLLDGLRVQSVRDRDCWSHKTTLTLTVRCSQEDDQLFAILLQA